VFFNAVNLVYSWGSAELIGATANVDGSFVQMLEIVLGLNHSGGTYYECEREVEVGVSAYWDALRVHLVARPSN
jgi:hypothetical protein